MKILVDTSAWSLFLTRKQTARHPAAHYLKEKISEGAPLCITGLVFQEILQGIRSETHYQEVVGYLLNFEFLATTHSIHEKAAGLYRRCRAKGLSIGTIDALLAACSIHHQTPLLTTDNDFVRIQKHAPLQLVKV
ncbi:MAG: PIN domain nuclease [Deltaproteobacteria bacterium]|nr:PIN domain nuclease [Deltaproteobacteria bacterium]